MKFVCSNCKAKYQIADEKILGRTLKMDCRRCNTAITIRGDLPQQADDVEMEADAPVARAPSRRPGAAAGGSSVGAAPSRPRSAATGSLAGHPSPSSLGADFRRGSIAPESRPETRTSVLDQWHVAINDVPVGPMRREEVSRKIATGAVTAESLAWREGFDDWRPVRDIPELAALLRKAEPLPNRSMPGPRGGATGAGARLAAASPSRLGARPASATSTSTATAAAARAGNVVPIGGRHGGAAPALDEFESLEGDQDEPTQIASAADLGLLALTAKPEAKAKAPEKPRAPERRDPTGPARPAAPPRPKNDVFAKSPSAPEPAPPAAKAALEPIDDGLPALVSPSLPPPEPAAFAPMPAPVAAPAPIASIPAQRAEEKRRRGLPVGAWMGIAGAMAFGVVFALMAAQRMFPATPTATAAAVVVPVPVAPTPVEAPLELDPVVEAPAETPPVAEVVPETPPTTAPAAGGSHSTGRTGSGSSAGTGTSGSGTTTGTGSSGLSADFARLADDSSGPRAIESEATRRSLGDSASTSGSELTSEQISHVVTRERAGLQRCWETAIRGMRETPTVRMDIDLTIGSSGTVTAANARGPSVGTLTDCIERSVRRWRFPTSSGTSRTSFPIVFSGTT
jgi:predicted Zn finger-like uncharacterized protein